LLIKSTQAFDRYLDNDEATAASFVSDGEGAKWFKTGDCAVKNPDKNDSTRILGRLSQDIIKKQGYKISALELEDRLMQFSGVRECAVIGVPHEEYGEEIMAFVVMKPG